MRRVALGALQGLSSRRRLRRCIGRLEVLGVLAPGRGRSRAGRSSALPAQAWGRHGASVAHAHHRAWRWNSNRACERALRYQLGDKIHGFTVNQDLQNVLSVYLDATFFPCLRELDFWTRMKTCTPAVRAFSLTDTESHYVVQAALELLGSSDPPASAFQCTGMTSMSYRAGPTALKFHNHLETLTFHPPWWLPEVSSSSRAKGFLSFAARVRSLKMLPLLLKAFD
ncbi:uncharacterized protein isoform X12 [Macaca fascicularis]|uniref:uncharacterized protein isoform X12 n=1 Tax=Macaca fascicularis TaxID=9541 RepID=UPI003D154077